MTTFCINPKCLIAVPCPDKPWCSEACRRAIAENTIALGDALDRQLAQTFAEATRPFEPVITCSPATYDKIKEFADTLTPPWPPFTGARLVIIQDPPRRKWYRRLFRRRAR